MDKVKFLGYACNVEAVHATVGLLTYVYYALGFTEIV